MRAGRGLMGKSNRAKAAAPPRPTSTESGVPFSNTAAYRTAREGDARPRVVAVRHSASNRTHRAISYFHETSAEAFAGSGLSVG